jgi:hypothetical protein
VAEDEESLLNALDAIWPAPINSLLLMKLIAPGRLSVITPDAIVMERTILER